MNVLLQITQLVNERSWIRTLTSQDCIPQSHMTLSLCFKGRAGITFHFRKRKTSPELGNSLSWWFSLPCVHLFFNTQLQALNEHWEGRDRTAPSSQERQKHPPVVYLCSWPGSEHQVRWFGVHWHLKVREESLT